MADCLSILTNGQHGKMSRWCLPNTRTTKPVPRIQTDTGIEMSKFVVPKDVKRLTAIQTGARNRAVAQNSLIRIGGTTMLMSEACRITGLHSKVIRQKVRAGTLDLAGFANG
jgi:hypothetical protein